MTIAKKVGKGIFLWQGKKFQIQGARILGHEAYLQYAAVTVK
jgi:hypothetical protein